MGRELENEYSKLKRELHQEQGKNRKLQSEISKLNEEIKDLKPSKSSQRIRELKEQLAEQEKINRNLHDAIYDLEHKRKQNLEGKGMISQSEYEGILKQLERERQLKEQYQRLYEHERNKRNELKESFKAENKSQDAIYPVSEENENLAMRVKELEARLSRKGTGKPRNNNISDDDVLKLRN